jgi:hypothetical protein
LARRWGSDGVGGLAGYGAMLASLVAAASALRNEGHSYETPPRLRGLTSAGEKKSREVCEKAHPGGARSRLTAKNRRGHRLIHQKIIGPRLDWLWIRLSRSSAFVQMRGILPLLHQPAGEHGGGVLFQPGIEKLANFLAEIGGMTQAREFIALKAVPRGREKELPRRLRGVTGQRGLPGDTAYRNCVITIINNNHRSSDCEKLWKSSWLEIQPASAAGKRAFVSEDC